MDTVEPVHLHSGRDRRLGKLAHHPRSAVLYHRSGQWERLERLPVGQRDTRFVLDTRIGKVRREDLRAFERNRGMATFERQGRLIEYPDFPAEMDVPGDPAIMLWKTHGRLH